MSESTVKYRNKPLSQGHEMVNTPSGGQQKGGDLNQG